MPQRVALTLFSAVLLPTACGLVVLSSFADRADHLDRVPAAVVNLDEPVTTGTGEDSRTIAGGRLLAARLTSPETDATRPTEGTGTAGDPAEARAASGVLRGDPGLVHTVPALAQAVPALAATLPAATVDEPPAPGVDGGPTLGWELVSASDAGEGLREGHYAAVVTIPRGFSRALASASGEKPEQATVAVETGSAAGDLVTSVSDRVSQAAVASIGLDVTTTFLEKAFDGFNDLGGSLREAADGAATLAGGARQLGDGAATLDDGAQGLASGLGTIHSGAGSLAAGTGRLTSGAGHLADGLSALRGGASTLDSGAAKLSSGTRTMAARSARLTSGTRDLVKGTRDFARALHATADSEDVAEMPENSAALAAGAAAVADGTAQVSTGLAGLSRQCAQAGAADTFCERLATLATSADALGPAATGVRTGTAQLAEQSPALVKGLGEAAATADGLVAGSKRLHAGSTELRGAIQQVARGSASLSSGVDRLSDGLGDAASGATRLSSGLASAGQGTRQLAGGLSTAWLGASRLAGGTGELVTGARRVAKGTEELADGLQDGAGQVPSYTKEEGERLAAVIAQPAVATHTGRSGLAAGSATPEDDPGLAPVVVALVLWLGAFASYLVLGALPRRASGAAASSTRLALTGWRPAAGMGVLQALLVAASLLAFDVSHGSPVAAVCLTLGAAVAFATVNQAFVAVCGHRLGRVVGVAFLVLQVAALGGSAPVETAPGLFRGLEGLLPVPLVVDGLTALSVDGGSGPAIAATTGLLLWALGAFGFTVLAARRRQTWTVGDVRAGLAPA